MPETGLRAGGVIGMHVTDLDLGRGVATVRRGKGGTGRVVPFGPQTAAAIDRYVRARRAHRLAATEPLWLGGGGHSSATTASIWRSSAAPRPRASRGSTFTCCATFSDTVATGGRLRGRADGGRGLVQTGHDRPLHRRQASERAAAEARGLGLGIVTEIQLGAAAHRQWSGLEQRRSPGSDHTKPAAL